VLLLLKLFKCLVFDDHELLSAFSYVNSEKPERQLGAFSADTPALTGSSSVER
jgi:hypothetical protein